MTASPDGRTPGGPVALCLEAMDWQPIKTAPPRTRVLICDEAKRVRIGRAAGLRWFDDTGHLLSLRPLWWMPLPEGPDEREVKKGSRRTRH